MTKWRRKAIAAAAARSTMKAIGSMLGEGCREHDETWGLVSSVGYLKVCLCRYIVMCKVEINPYVSCFPHLVLTFMSSQMSRKSMYY